MAGDKPITVDKEWFVIWEGTQLLESIGSKDLRGTQDQLQKVLTCMEAKYGEHGTEKNRKSWRDDRIKLYNELLLLALGADDQELETWTTEENRPCHPQSDLNKVTWKGPFVTGIATSYLQAPGSIYTYLLDHIHEDEEIMFKYYHAQNRSKDPCLRKKALWLVESIKAYRINLVSSVVNALKLWDERKKDLCRELLEKAKETFKEKVLSYGRSWKDRSWRNRARLYWLLAQAKHAPISRGQVGRYKSPEYSGPIRTLVQEMIKEDEEMLLEHAEGSFFQYARVKYDKRRQHLVPLGTFKICRLLAWASAVNDHDLVMCILQHKRKYTTRIESDWEWEESWEESWAHALWNAAYMGHEQIVKALLNCDFPYHELYFRFYSKKSMQPPLHVAVCRGHLSAVEAFCERRTYRDSGESKNFSCHDENEDRQTPLEVATTLKDKVTKRKIQSILLQRLEVKQAVEELSLQRQLTVGSANAIMVGATLIAGVTYAGWLQPPLGYHAYYQITEPLPAPPNTFQSYLSVQGHTTVQVFAICNSLSFFFAIAAVIAGMETTCFIEAPEETYIAKTVEKLRYKLKGTTVFFITSVICVLIAFASAGVAILPPIDHQQKILYVTIGVGGFFCMVFIGRMLLFCVSKRLYKRIAKQFRRMFKWMVQKIW